MSIPISIPESTRVVPLLRTPAQWWRDLTAPHPSLTGEDWRSAHLMLSMAAAILPIIFIGMVYTLFRDTDAANQDLGIISLPVIAFVMVALAYLLGRTRRHRLGAYLFVAVPTLAMGAGSLLTNELPFTYQLFYFVLGAVLASLLLNPRETLIVSVANFVLANLLIIVLPQWDYPALIDELMFNILVPALLIVSASVRAQYLAQINQQMGELAQAEAAERAARQTAERAEQVKSSFLASMSHELRTPLNAVINFTKFVMDGDLGAVNSEQQETLGRVIRSAKHLLGLINDVLDMSKIEAGALNLFVVDQVNLDEIIDLVVMTGRSLVGEKPVTITTEIEPNLPALRGDRQRITQILLNVMSNACKFTAHGQITLRAAISGDDVLLSVKDTGPGIMPDELPLVFQPFKQTQAGLRHGGGTGLGMPISRNLVEKHGGQLWVESEPGQGATFFISLPIRSESLKPTISAA